MPTVRQTHNYLGFFVAPSILFFALTGILQLFSLHEAHDIYKPPALFVTLGSLHKDQVLSKPHEGSADAHRPSPDANHGKPHPAKLLPVRVYVLKWFFAIVALCLVISTALGLYIGFKYARRPALCWTLLIVGAAIPLLLIFV